MPSLQAVLDRVCTVIAQAVGETVASLGLCQCGTSSSCTRNLFLCKLLQFANFKNKEIPQGAPALRAHRCLCGCAGAQSSSHCCELFKNEYLN